MDADDIGELTNQARIYGIKYKYDRIGIAGGDEFEYTINFGPGLTFKNSRAAMKFIDAIIQEHCLKEKPGSYRVGFGWEV